ncbi:MAG: ABC transporter ATP-binding protein/permease [Oscillospiraceae bacterium]|nr:ABC transporter ATP-binding protein/permease [Oscillospiraceae bacterium]
MFLTRWLWKNLKGNRAQWITAIIISSICAATTFAAPAFTSYIIDHAVVGVTKESGEFFRNPDLLYTYAFIMIPYVIIRLSVFYLMLMLIEFSSQGLIVRLRNHLYKNMQRQDSVFFDKNRTGDLMTRLTGDLDMIRHFVAWVTRMGLDSILIFSTTLIYLFWVNWQFALIFAAVSPLIFVLRVFIRKNVRPLHLITRQKLSELNNRTGENIAGNKVVKTFAREEHEKEVFAKYNNAYKTASENAARKWFTYFPFMEGMAFSFIIITLLVGGFFFMADKLTMGEYVAFSTLAWQVSNPMRNFGMVMNDFQRFFSSAEKVVELYYASPTIVDRHDVENLTEPLSGKIELNNVSLVFDGRAILEDISFDVEPGETIAIMGPTGCGKTLLINLLGRLYDINSGSIRFDGIDINRLKLADLRSAIGIATQEVFLFSDTVDGNISYSDSSMSEDDTRLYARYACADFISGLEEGYDTIIGERGTGLSGGQKQRIALARALAKKPAILILDDTTSAVDLETEKEIRSNLDNLPFKATKIIIAQRVSTTKYADKIIIMDHGRITEMGTHDQLIANGGYYREIYDLQNDLGGVTVGA